VTPGDGKPLDLHREERSALEGHPATPMEARRRAARNGFRFVRVGLAVLLLVVLVAGLQGCVKPSPFLAPAVREELRRAEPLDLEAVIEEPIVELSAVPLEPPAETVERARAAAEPHTNAPTITLHLPEVRASVLENNLDLEVSAFDPSIAEQGYQAQLGKFEEILDATAEYREVYGADAGVTERISINPTIRVPTRAGGFVSVGLPVVTDKTAEFDPLSASFNRVRTYSLGVDLALSQPLLRNAGPEIDYASISVTGLQMRQADARAKLTAIRLLATAEQAYWEYYTAHENLKIAVQQYDYAAEQLEMSKVLVREGVRTTVEITRAESGVALRFGVIITAETRRRIAERALKRIMNRPDLTVGSSTIILTGTEPTPMGLVFDRNRVLDLAERNRMELLDNEIQQAIDRITVAVDKNATLPDLRFDFVYSFSGSQPGFNDTLDRIFKKELNSYSASLFLELPLRGNQSARARLRESLLRQAQTDSTRQLLELAIGEEVYNSIDTVEQNWQSILSNRVAVASAERTYSAERIQFQLGVINGQDLLNSLNQFAVAELRQVQAVSAFQNSLVDLAFSTGTVLGKGGVVWTPAPRP